MFGLCIVRFDKILIIVSKAKNLVAGFTVVLQEKETNPVFGSDCMRRYDFVAIYKEIFMSLDLNCS